MLCGNIKSHSSCKFNLIKFNVISTIFWYVHPKFLSVLLFFNFTRFWWLKNDIWYGLTCNCHMHFEHVVWPICWGKWIGSKMLSMLQCFNLFRGTLFLGHLGNSDDLCYWCTYIIHWKHLHFYAYFHQNCSGVFWGRRTLVANFVVLSLFGSLKD